MIDDFSPLPSQVREPRDKTFQLIWKFLNSHIYIAAVNAWKFESVEFYSMSP
jgi:hypothetical protein